MKVHVVIKRMDDGELSVDRCYARINDAKRRAEQITEGIRYRSEHALHFGGQFAIKEAFVVSRTIWTRKLKWGKP